MKTFMLVILIISIILGLSCNPDLDVPNWNEPDRERVFSDPMLTEAYLGGTFYYFWMTQVDWYSPVFGLSCLADEFTCSWGSMGSLHLSSEPRKAWDNSPTYGYRNATLRPWQRLYHAITSVNDILNLIDNGMTFIEEDGMDNTERNKAFARFIQGISYGFLGLLFDQTVIVDENTDLESGTPPMIPYSQIIDFAIEKLIQCIDLCHTNTFDIPERWWPGNQFNQDDLAALAHAYAARILAGESRLPEDRDTADWTKIKHHAQRGLTEDFSIQCDGSTWYSFLHGLGSNEGFFRTDYKLIGPADTSGNFIAWLATPVLERNEFDIHTNDRRITGENPTAIGLYFDHYGRCPYRSNRGTYHFSRYHCCRFLEYYQADYVGWVPIMTVAEINLLRAEAELRLGNPQTAADLINLTRVPNGGLPPATPENIGHPGDPRGPRGSLWAMLKYEKGIETCQAQMGVAWFDRRGWGTLVPGSILHFPIPGSELELMGLPIYTFGGVGGEGAAPGY